MESIRYRGVELPSDEPVQFVGVYVLNWKGVVSGDIVEPTVGFVEDDKETRITMEAGATMMIESLKADRLIPDDIDKDVAASEAIRRHYDPMSPPNSINDMRED